VVIWEVKSTHATPHTRRNLLSVEERTEELRRMGIPDAVDQLSNTINDLRNGDLDALIPLRYDWTSTMIIPAAITIEKVPLVPGSWRIIEPLTSPLLAVGLSDQIAPLRILDITAFEELIEHASGKELGHVLLCWARHPTHMETSFPNFAHGEGMQRGTTRLKARVAASMRLFARKIGMDEDKLLF